MRENQVTDATLSMSTIVKDSGGDLDKAIRLFNRATSAAPVTADLKQSLADEFNATWNKLHPNRPLKIAKGSRNRIIRSREVAPAGYRVPPGWPDARQRRELNLNEQQVVSRQ